MALPGSKTLKCSKKASFAIPFIHWGLRREHKVGSAIYVGSPRNREAKGSVIDAKIVRAQRRAPSKHSLHRKTDNPSSVWKDEWEMPNEGVNKNSKGN